MCPSFWKLLLCSLHLNPFALHDGDSVGFLLPPRELAWCPLTTLGLGELSLSPPSPQTSLPFLPVMGIWHLFLRVHCPLHSAGDGVPLLASACQVLLIGDFRRSRAKGRRLARVSLPRWALTYFSEYTQFPAVPCALNWGQQKGPRFGAGRPGFTITEAGI